MRRFYKLADPTVVVLAEQVGAIHGGDPKIKPVLTAWIARAMANRTLAQPCACCTRSTDMITDAAPNVIIPEEEFYAEFCELSQRLN